MNRRANLSLPAERRLTVPAAHRCSAALFAHGCRRTWRMELTEINTGRGRASGSAAHPPSPLCDDMAWLFSLSAECGPNKHDAESVAAHFNDYNSALDDGSRYPCTSDVSEIDGTWWANCYPEGVSIAGVGNKKDERVMTAVGFSLYEWLMTAPPYRFAIVGVEVEGFREYDEIDSDVTELDFSGLVLSDAIWRRLGAPAMFVPFASGYHWRPFVRAR